MVAPSRLVVVAQADETHYYRGEGVNACNPFPPGPMSNLAVGCAVVGENPQEDNDRQVWGRWAHELGHAFQKLGPWHPSHYNSEFELMDCREVGEDVEIPNPPGRVLLA